MGSSLAIPAESAGEVREVASRLLALSDEVSARARVGEADALGLSDWAASIDGCAWDLMRIAEGARIRDAVGPGQIVHDGRERE